MTLNLATHCDDGDPESSDTVAQQSCRPSFIGLFAIWAGGDKIETFPVTDGCASAYISHAADDKVASTAFSEEIVAAWKSSGLSVRYEAYPTGGHEGFNFPNKPHSDEWPNKFLAWLNEPGVDTLTSGENN